MKRLPSPSRIIVFGAGALGSLLGGQLSSAIPVVLIGRDWHIQPIRTRGLQMLTGPDKRSNVVSIDENFSVYSQISDLSPPVNSNDVILLCVKAFQVAQAASELGSAALPSTQPVLLTFQNGTGFEKDLAPLAARGFRVHCCVSHLGAFIKDPGFVEDCGGQILLPDIPDCRPLATLLIQSEIRCTLVANIQSERWKKITFNCALNPLCALLDVRNNETLTDSLLPWRASVIKEINTIASTAGIALPPSQALLDEFEELVKPSDNVNSMLQDIRKGRRTEIEFLNGAILRLAEKHDVSAPKNQLLTHWIQKVEQAKSKAQRSKIQQEACQQLFVNCAIPADSTANSPGSQKAGGY